MSFSVTPENKNNLTITNAAKMGTADTWAMHTETWAESGGTWSAPGFPIIKESKNSLTVTNETKL